MKGIPYDRKKRHRSHFDPEKFDFSSSITDEIVKFVTSIEAPTMKQKFAALEALAEKAPKGDGTLNLITDIISELQKPSDHSNDPKDVAEGKENAKQGALRQLKFCVNNPDTLGPDGTKAVIELAASFYRLVDHFSVLASQTEAMKSNPF